MLADPGAEVGKRLLVPEALRLAPTRFTDRRARFVADQEVGRAAEPSNRPR
jgi:hypothetical protein